MVTLQIPDDDARALLANLSRASLPTHSPAARLRDELKCALAVCACGDPKKES